MESVVRRSLASLRLRLLMGEVVENWGEFKRYIADPLNEMAVAAKRREQEIVAMLAANTPGSIRNMEAERHTSELWNLISHIASVLQNGPDAATHLARLHRHGAIIKLPQLPWHPAAGILWPERRCHCCDSFVARRKRQLEAERLFWAA